MPNHPEEKRLHTISNSRRVNFPRNISHILLKANNILLQASTTPQASSSPALGPRPSSKMALTAIGVSWGHLVVALPVALAGMPSVVREATAS